MITYRSIPYFPKGIILNESSVIDTSIGSVHKINQMAHFILSKIDGKRTVKNIIGIVSAHFRDVENTQIETDVLKVLTIMNNYNVLNIKFKFDENLNKLVISLMQGKYISVSKRYDIETFSFFLILLFIYYQVLKHMIPTLILVAGLGAIPIISTGNGDFILVWVCSLLIFLVVLLSIAFHETSHIYMLRKEHRNKCTGFLKVGFLSFKILRPKIHDDALIAISGPLLTTGIGVLLSWFCMFITHPIVHFVLLICSGVFLIHCINLLPFFSDGKKLFLKILNL